jgi:hypothetical protein
MGNTSNFASDVAVDSVDDIQEISEEQKFETEIKEYNQNLIYLSSLSEKYKISCLKFNNPKFIVIGSTIYEKVKKENFSFLIIYNIENDSVKVIHMKETDWSTCYKSPVKENEFFTYKLGKEGVYYFNLTEVTPDEDMRIQGETLLKRKYSSVSYFNTELIRILDIKSLSIHKLVQKDEKLYVFTNHPDFVVDIQKNEILEEFCFTKISQRSRMTDHYIYYQNLGFGMIGKDLKSRKIIIPGYFNSISKNEEFILFYNNTKMMGFIHPMTEWRENNPKKKIESTSISFSLLDVPDFLKFSEDSEFVYILRNGISLLVFSIRENKFVFKLDLHSSTVHTKTIQLIDDFILFLALKRRLIFSVRIKIPPKLKPYIIHSPGNIQFRFK